MRTFVVAVVAMLVWDIAVKFWRLAMGRTQYSEHAIAIDGLFSVAFALWGAYVLAGA